ncbi:MAG: GC-type dockerin domain-anchored protein [Planctomycetota bacterium]
MRCVNRILTCAAVSTLAAGGVHAQLEIDWYTIDAGGGRSSGGGFEIIGTIGQHDASGPSIGGPLELTGGFWAGVVTESVSCTPDLTTNNTNPGSPGYGVPDGVVSSADLTYFVESWINSAVDIADVNTDGANPGDEAYGQPDGTVTTADLTYFVEQWLVGCP